MAAILPIVKLPAKILREKTREVSSSVITSPSLKRLIADMKETLKHTPDGVGLAAPQVGESLRLFIVSDEAEEIDKTELKRWHKSDGEWKREEKKPYETREWTYYVFINPVVKKTARKKLDAMEGCLSVPEKFGLVARTERITIEAYDENGKKFTRGTSRFVARVIQHELDHLEGKLFIDKVSKSSQTT